MRPASRVLEVFLAFLRLGLTSFGGPAAHLGYFRRAFVRGQGAASRGWLDDAAYAEIVALCSFLPGPTSSQVGMVLGTLRAGAAGAFAAWIGFTLPSATLMTLVAYGLPLLGVSAWIHGLLLAAVAVVADAIVGMGRTLTPDPIRLVLALACTVVVLQSSGTWGQLIVLLLGVLVGIAFLRQPEESVPPLPIPFGRSTGATMLACFALAFALLPALAHESGTWQLVEAFFRAGSLVFGGGHVVLPLLQVSFVPQTIDAARFLAGYGATQAVPGPLFTFAAYLGASVSIGPGGWLGALIATCAIFAPSFFLIFGIAPFWRDVRGDRNVAAAVRGLGAAVVGLLAAAFVHPIWTSAILSWTDAAIAAIAFVLLRLQKIPPWGAVALAAVLGGTAAALR